MIGMCSSVMNNLGKAARTSANRRMVHIHIAAQTSSSVVIASCQLTQIATPPSATGGRKSITRNVTEELNTNRPEPRAKNIK